MFHADDLETGIMEIFQEAQKYGRDTTFGFTHGSHIVEETGPDAKDRDRERNRVERLKKSGGSARTCAHCQAPFVLVDGDKGNRRFCSRRCQSNSSGVADRARKSLARAAALAGAQCQRCGGPFQKPLIGRGSGSVRYCSLACRRQVKSEVEARYRASRVSGRRVVCARCGDGFERARGASNQVCGGCSARAQQAPVTPTIEVPRVEIGQSLTLSFPEAAAEVVA